MQREGKLESPPLTLADGSASRFKLWVYPRGDTATDAEAAGYVSLYIATDFEPGSNLIVPAKCKLGLTNQASAWQPYKPNREKHSTMTTVH